PDSPTSAYVVPFSTARSTPSTARTAPRDPSYSTRRLSMDRSGANQNTDASRCVPKTPRSRSAISPSVASASTAARMDGIRLAPERAASATASREDVARAPRRDRGAARGSRPPRPAAAAPLRGGAGRAGRPRDRGPRCDPLLPAVGGLVALRLREPALDRSHRSAQRVDLDEVLLRSRLERVGQRLDEIRARERIDGVGDAGLVREDLLRPEG